jgi:hypothetical protein
VLRALVARHHGNLDDLHGKIVEALKRKRKARVLE